MTPFTITILGSSSAMPTMKRNLTSQLLQFSNQFFLIDCGEGTQYQLIRNNLKFHRINHIFISHLHGDHYYGLVGLLSTFHLLGRTKELHLYCPPDLKKILEIQLQYSETSLKYPLNFHLLKFDGCDIIYEDNLLSVSTIKLNHRIPCNGFLFQEKQQPGKLLPEVVGKYNIPIFQRTYIKQGGDFKTKDGNTIKNEMLTAPAPHPRSYAYCSDTAYNTAIVEQIKGVDLLYHEATFLSDKAVRAEQTFHSTAKQAASIAKQAHAGQLLLGHISARYTDASPLLEEAKAVFENTIIVQDGKSYEVCPSQINKNQSDSYRI